MCIVAVNSFENHHISCGIVHIEEMLMFSNWGKKGNNLDSDSMNYASTPVLFSIISRNKLVCIYMKIQLDCNQNSQPFTKWSFGILGTKCNEENKTRMKK